MSSHRLLPQSLGLLTSLVFSLVLLLSLTGAAFARVPDSGGFYQETKLVSDLSGSLRSPIPIW